MKYFLSILAVFTVVTVSAQRHPVEWNTSILKLSTNKYEIRLKATVEKGWHLYSQHTTPGGPFPTVVRFAANPMLTVEGVTQEKGELHQKFEPLFKVDVQYYNREVEFVARVTRKANVKTNFTGYVNYMVCNDQECLPPKTFSFEVKID